MIKTKCKIINNNLIYIPIDIIKISPICEKVFYSKCMSECFIIKIDFYNIETNFKFHLLNANLIEFKSEMCCNFLCYELIQISQLYKNILLNNEILEGDTLMISCSINTNYDNLLSDICELTICDLSNDLTNLPIYLKKLTLINKKKEAKVKVPFNCKYIEREI